MKCSICHGPIDRQRLPDGTVYWAKGHNAWPVNEGRCCSDCNFQVVLHARLNQVRQYTEEIENGTSK
jgi:hypothetical protein